MGPNSFLLDAVFAEIRTAMSAGDQQLADALARVLSRATQAAKDVKAARVVHREARMRLTTRPAGFGRGDGLDRFRGTGLTPGALLLREARAAHRVRDAFRARGTVARAGTVVREPHPLPLPSVHGRHGPMIASPVLRRPTFTYFN